jgi:hypothetical protein
MTVAKAVGWGIWASGALAAGAMKPILFPNGGWPYAVAALTLLVACAIVGVAVEQRLSRSK